MPTSPDSENAGERSFAMTATVRRRLMLLGKLASIAGALAAAGCKDDLKDRTFRLEFPITREQTRAMVGRADLGAVWQMIVFAEPLRFKRVGETIEAFGYEALTLADYGEVHTGKYAMRATLRKGYTGGPAGFATQYVVDVEDVRLVGKLVAPPALPGRRGILPGELVVRDIGEGELQRLDDRYLVDLPAKSSIRISIYPLPEQYGFRLSVTRDGASMPLHTQSAHYEFETPSAGIHEVRVLPAEAPVPREPASYRLDVVWGDALTKGDLDSGDVQWRDVRSSPEPGGAR
jgi:hypothetical protein